MKIVLDREKLRTIRKMKKITQENLAELLDISPRHMNCIECEEVNIHAPLLYRLSKALNTPMEELLQVTDEPIE